MTGQSGRSRQPIAARGENDYRPLTPAAPPAPGGLPAVPQALPRDGARDGHRHGRAAPAGDARRPGRRRGAATGPRRGDDPGHGHRHGHRDGRADGLPPPRLAGHRADDRHVPALRHLLPGHLDQSHDPRRDPRGRRSAGRPCLRPGRPIWPSWRDWQSWLPTARTSGRPLPRRPRSRAGRRAGGGRSTMRQVPARTRRSGDCCPGFAPHATPHCATNWAVSPGAALGRCPASPGPLPRTRGPPAGRPGIGWGFWPVRVM
jgi:hypothetical protein